MDTTKTTGTETPYPAPLGRCIICGRQEEVNEYGGFIRYHHCQAPPQNINVATSSPCADLLRQAKYLLAQMQRLHVASEKIGRCQQAGLSDTGICDLEIAQCGQLIENADRLCAEIDKSLSSPNNL